MLLCIRSANKFHLANHINHAGNSTLFIIRIDLHEIIILCSFVELSATLFWTLDFLLLHPHMCKNWRQLHFVICSAISVDFPKEELCDELAHPHHTSSAWQQSRQQSLQILWLVGNAHDNSIERIVGRKTGKKENMYYFYIILVISPFCYLVF